jgi:hypothetical protein
MQQFTRLSRLAWPNLLALWLAGRYACETLRAINLSGPTAVNGQGDFGNGKYLGAQADSSVASRSK